MEPQGAVAEDLIPIGRFARLSGLSIGALRHYGELDVLRPADVDRFTGYRRYRPGQLEIARAIGRLRDLEVPIDEIREVLGADDPADQRRRIGTHERRLQARVDRLAADDWDVPAALEGLARAQAVAGQSAAAEATRARARESLEGIADPEHRQVIEQDLESTPI